jgi:hypothetical protein
MPGSVPKFPDPFLNVRIRSLISRSVPKFPDPLPNVRSVLNVESGRKSIKKWKLSYCKKFWVCTGSGSACV